MEAEAEAPSKFTASKTLVGRANGGEFGDGGGVDNGDSKEFVEGTVLG